MSDRPVDDSAMSDDAGDVPEAPGGTAPAAQPSPPAPGPPPVPPMPSAIPPYAVPPAPPAAPAGAAPQYPTTPYPTQLYGSPAAYGQQTAAYAAPSQGYAPPQGYQPPPQGYGPYTPQRAPVAARGGSALGVVAFALAVLAAFGATIVGSIAAYSIGLGTGQEIMLDPAAADFDWSILAPVRGWVLMAELAFWAGTVLGIWALVQGIIATVKNRGRGWGIAALVIALFGPVAFALGFQAFLLAGFAAGASVSG
ncbi:MAG: hypothetical protein ACXWZG_03060 [Microbacterium sp.]